MKTPDHPDPLGRLLATWQQPPLVRDPGFEDAVHARLRTSRVRNGADTTLAPFVAGDGRGRVLRFPAPLAAAASVALAALLGATAALFVSHNRATERMASAYVASINPLERVHAGHSAAPAVPAAPASHVHPAP
ncbi:MAG: hypothetical protein LBK99_06915 [Opitutaceae bacterium]|nr:hypothetical protein [Opitutaceae bacterium]